MSGYTKIIHSPYTLYVSFRSVGGRKKFDFLMDRFNSSFPSKVWDEKYHAWQLAPDDLAKVIRFSKSVFGAQGYVLQGENTTTDFPSQPSFL
jgi:hypothetical protein